MNYVFFGSADGTVSVLNPKNKICKIQKYHSQIDTMIPLGTKNRIVIVTRSLLLIQLELQGDGSFNEVEKMKISVSLHNSGKGLSHVLKIFPGVIAGATDENLIRFWDLNANTSFVLPLESAGIRNLDWVTALSFNPLLHQFAAGTAEGVFVIWEYKNRKQDCSSLATGQLSWHLIKTRTVSASDKIQTLQWGYQQSIVVGCSTKVNVISEEKFCYAIHRNTFINQLSRNTVQIQQKGKSSFINVDICMNIKNLVISSRHFTAWNGKEICVYKLQYEKCERISYFPFISNDIAMLRDSLYIAQDTQLVVTNLHGVQKLSIPFSVDDGKPILLDICNEFLAVASNSGNLKLFNISKRDPQSLLTNNGQFVDSRTKRSLGYIKSIKCNSNGTKLTILAHRTKDFHEVDAKIYIYDRHRNSIDQIIFGSKDKVPISHFWDSQVPYLLSCEVFTCKNSGKFLTSNDEMAVSEVICHGKLVTIFCIVCIT